LLARFKHLTIANLYHNLKRMSLIESVLDIDGKDYTLNYNNVYYINDLIVKFLVDDFNYDDTEDEFTLTLNFDNELNVNLLQSFAKYIQNNIDNYNKQVKELNKKLELELQVQNDNSKTNL